jgi:hypothetical protein
MLVRISTTRAAIPRTGEGIAYVHGEIQPKISAMDGNRGFALAVDRSSGRYLGIAAWTDREALEAGNDRAPGLIADVARRLHGSEPTVEVYDLALAHLVKPVRVGYWGRLVRFAVPLGDLDLAVRKFGTTALALFERYEGLAAVVLFVDRPRGVAESAVWYESVEVLKGSRARTEELWELLVADVPALDVVEVSELEVVIAEMGPLG